MRLRVSVNRRRFCEYAFEKCGDGLFRLSGSGHGDLPDGATRHAANSSMLSLSLGIAGRGQSGFLSLEKLLNACFAIRQHGAKLALIERRFLTGAL